jgi:hypothetical protein
MRKLLLLCAWLCAMGFVVTVSGRPAQAFGSNVITYISANGNNAAGCSTPATACATLGGALSYTVPEGEIDCVDAGNYSNTTVIITQSVTIDCAGGVGSTAGAFSINGSGIVVRLRNLTLNNNGFGFYGIDAKNMAALYVENCVITNANAVNGLDAPISASSSSHRPTRNCSSATPSSAIMATAAAASPAESISRPPRA